jgi:hypothetical protein
MNAIFFGKLIPENRIETLGQRLVKPEWFVDKKDRGSREKHTQKKFVPAAIKASLATAHRRRSPLTRSQPGTSSRTLHRGSTLLLNRSLKRKASLRGLM